MHSTHNHHFTNDKLATLNKLVIFEPITIHRWHSAHAALQEFREKYPFNQLWQLAVDGKFYEVDTQKDPKGYRQFEEREPGCLQAFFRGLNCALENLDDPSKSISLDLIKDIHRAACTGVDCLQQALQPGIFKQETDACFFNFKTNSNVVTLEGMSDLLTRVERREIGEHVVIYIYYKKGINKKLPTCNLSAISIPTIKEKMSINTNTELAAYIMRSCNLVKYFPPISEEVDQLIEAAIDHYNKHILSDVIQDNSDNVLRLIGETIQKFQRIHPFPDANGRTFVNLLLNRMLLQNGFPPATYYEPNVFDAFTNDHVPLLKRAIVNTLDVYTGKDLFGFNIDTQFSADDIIFFKNMPELKTFYETTSNNQKHTLRIQAKKPKQASTPLAYVNENFRFLAKKPKAKLDLAMKNNNKNSPIKK